MVFVTTWTRKCESKNFNLHWYLLYRMHIGVFWNYIIFGILCGKDGVFSKSAAESDFSSILGRFWSPNWSNWERKGGKKGSKKLIEKRVEKKARGGMRPDLPVGSASP